MMAVIHRHYCFETFPFPEELQDTIQVLEAVGRIYHDYRASVMVCRNEGMTKTYNRFHNRRETAADIVRLREVHAEMDRAVLAAYGWDDLAERAEPSSSMRRTRTTTNTRAGCSGRRSSATRCWRACSRSTLSAPQPSARTRLWLLRPKGKRAAKRLAEANCSRAWRRMKTIKETRVGKTLLRLVDTGNSFVGLAIVGDTTK